MCKAGSFCRSDWNYLFSSKPNKALKRFIYLFSRDQYLIALADSYLTMETDCGDRLCNIDYKILPTCHMYVKTPGNCSIPCNVAECKIEIFHQIRCPVIHCFPKPSTTTVSPFTIAPLPTNSDCSGPVCISLLALNILFFIVIVTGAILGYCFYKKTRRAQYQNIDEIRPIIRGFSNVELRTPSPTPENRFRMAEMGSTLRRFFTRTSATSPDVENSAL